MNKIGITIGDPAGVGPELIVKLWEHFNKESAYVIYGEKKTLEEASKLLGSKLALEAISSPQEINSPGVYVTDMNILETAVPQPSISSGKVAVAYLARAVVDAVYGNIDGILTMPLNKFWAARAGFSYKGQTEYLAQAASIKEFAMMMYSSKLKVVLLSTHVPVAKVSDYVKKDRVLSKVMLIHREYKKLFGKEPLIGVLGLNPHAGEMGEIGREDIEEILPAVETAKREGIKVEGPLVPDVAFMESEDYDVFLCMYHDQGLIPFKLLAFKEGVNLTLGIPFPRTSPDHGTAYDIAWKGISDPSSSIKALELLEHIIHNLKS